MTNEKVEVKTGLAKDQTKSSFILQVMKENPDKTATQIWELCRSKGVELSKDLVGLVMRRASIKVEEKAVSKEEEIPSKEKTINITECIKKMLLLNPHMRCKEIHQKIEKTYNVKVKKTSVESGLRRIRIQGFGKVDNKLQEIPQTDEVGLNVVETIRLCRKLIRFVGKDQVREILDLL